MQAYALQIGLTVAVAIAHIVVVISLLIHERRQPSSTMAWLLALILLPVLGLLAYWTFGRVRARRLSGAYKRSAAAVAQLMQTHDVDDKLRGNPDIAIGSRTQRLLRLGERLSDTPLSSGNGVQLLVDGDETSESLRAAVRGAKEHIHVELYIIQPDEVGRAMRDELTAKAQAGVEVRVVYDAVGSAKLSRAFWSSLTQAGGQVAVFRPVGPILRRAPWRDRIDYRNHRKIIVVDGRVGFTGGFNAGREYLGRDPTIGPWRDTYVQIRGPAVLSLQRAFLQDWMHASGTALENSKYFPAPITEEPGCAVQVIASVPMQAQSPISYLFTHCFHLARERIWIASPYFIPEPALEQALASAALRGVDVRLLVPLKADHRLVSLAGHSYFPALLEAGVRIFRYEPGFMHAKTLLVDEWVCAVGSANMDMRSFHLNYELTAFLFGHEICGVLESQFEQDFSDSRELTLQEEQRVGFGHRFARAGARLMSPLF